MKYKKLIKINSKNEIIDYKLHTQLGNTVGYIEIGETNNKHEILDIFDNNLNYKYKYENEEIIKKTEVELENEKKIKEAYSELLRTDKKIPRVVEDIYDVLTSTQKSNLPQITIDKINDKKIKRQNYLKLLKG